MHDQFFNLSIDDDLNEQVITLKSSLESAEKEKKDSMADNPDFYALLDKYNILKLEKENTQDQVTTLEKDLLTAGKKMQGLRNEISRLTSVTNSKLNIPAEDLFQSPFLSRVCFADP